MVQFLCALPPAPPPSIATFISNHPTLSLLEKSCTTMRDLHQLHANLITTGLARHTIAITRVLAFSASADPDYALLVFSHIDHPTSFAWNTIIRCLSRSSTPHLAISLFLDMLLSPIHPQRLTFPSLFTAFTRLGRAGDGRQLHGMVVKLGLAADVYVRNAVLSMYASCGHVAAASRVFDECSGCFDVVSWNCMMLGLLRGGLLDEARKLFDEMPERSVSTWSTMISGYVRNARHKEVLDLFATMQEAGLEPNSCILVSLLGACGCLGVLEQGKWVHAFIEKNGIEVNPIVLTAIIDMYCKCGCVDKAIQVFEAFLRRGLSPWNSMISGMAMHGRGEEAIGMFSRLLSSGLRPDNVSFVGVLTACNHSGMVDEARKHFASMTRTYGIEPTIEHYGCMVDLLSRAGHLEEAEELIKKMPMDPDVIIWGSLLSACRNHGNVEMGKRAAKRIIELDPSDSGGYIHLANAYAGAGEFGDAVNVRQRMKEKKVARMPGCSMVEVEGVVHEFVANGRLHPIAKEIHSLLNGLALTLDEAGYVELRATDLMGLDCS